MTFRNSTKSPLQRICNSLQRAGAKRRAGIPRRITPSPSFAIQLVACVASPNTLLYPHGSAGTGVRKAQVLQKCFTLPYPILRGASCASQGTRWHEDLILRIEIVRSGIAVSVRLSLLAFPSPCRGTSKTPTHLSEDTYDLQVRL
jgi:hypothetical protein